MNPYETPATFDSKLAAGESAQRRFGPGLIAALLIVAVLTGFLSQVVPSVRAITMPRFGWIGLVLCLNPLIFLLLWLWTPSRPTLLGAALMTFALGLINAAQLLVTGTVSIVTNEFTERLHSSWLWSVMLFIIAGGYLFWHAMRFSSKQLDSDSIQRANASKSSEI
jgi:hypothetical protein